MCAGSIRGIVKASDLHGVPARARVGLDPFLAQVARPSACGASATESGLPKDCEPLFKFVVNAMREIFDPKRDAAQCGGLSK